MLPFRGATAPCRYALKTSLSVFLFFSRHLFNCILKRGERYVSGSLSPAGIREDVGHRRWVPLQKDGRGRELHERAAKGSVDHCTATRYPCMFTASLPIGKHKRHETTQSPGGRIFTNKVCRATADAKSKSPAVSTTPEPKSMRFNPRTPVATRAQPQCEVIVAMRAAIGRGRGKHFINLNLENKNWRAGNMMDVGCD